jgi:RNA polymerase-interacting CarD/CdnL/TRCF family regulator
MHVTVPVAPKLISDIRAAIAAAARDKSNQHVKTGKETPRSMSQSRSQVSLLKKHEPLFVPSTSSASSTAPVASDAVPAEKQTSAPALHQSKSQPLLMQHLAESFRASIDSSRRSQEHEMSIRRIRLLENENKRLTDKLHVVENETAIKIRSLEGQLKLNMTKRVFVPVSAWFKIC